LMFVIVFPMSLELQEDIKGVTFTLKGG
jgi:hypothetical protein